VALQHLPESREVLEQAIDLRIDLRNALWPLAEHGRSLEYLRDAESVAKVLNDRRRLGWVSSYQAEDFWRTGNPDRAVESGQRALAIAAALGDFGLQVVTNRHLGQAYHTLGDYPQAMDFLRRNVASLKGEPLRERFGSPNIPSVISRVYLVWSLAEQGAFAEGVVMGEEAVRIAESANYPISLIAAYCGVGILYLRRGDLHQAIPALERGLGLCKLWNILIWFPRTACALGYGYALSGRVAEALPLLEQAVEQATSSRRMVEQSLRVACLGETYLLASRIDEAIQLGHRALELARTHKEGGHEAWTLRLLGQIHAHRDPPNADQANAHYREALVLADELGMRPVIAHCRLGLGKLYAKSGRRAEACAELSAAVDLYRAMEMTFWLPEAEAALAQVEGR
jgi:tetratricopeptide (TPR) repeat protein